MFKPEFFGRSSRSEYWASWAIYVVALAFMILTIKTNWTWLALIGGGIVGWLSICMLCLFSRRLHDIGQSGAWAVLLFVPAVSFAFLLFIGFKDGQRGSNQYGENPNGIEAEVQSVQPTHVTAQNNDRTVLDNQFEHLEKLQKLRDSGAIIDDEFNDLKHKILG
ncbi:hypothetical protein FACS1894103_5910 [Campylobacterota bacterium]|nr:hypothetical protein FACS1894103_5910 [Campylobacterota bacterium]